MRPAGQAGGCRTGGASPSPSGGVSSHPLPRKWGAATHPRHRSAPRPPRITNTGEELDPSGKMIDTVLGRHAPLRLEAEHQGAKPGDLPLERSVGMQYLEALFSDAVVPEDGAYWFNCPEDGWVSGEVVRERATEVEAAPLTGLRNPDEPGFASKPCLTDLRVGDTFEGAVVQGGAYCSGILVDIGAQWDGLLPVAPTEVRMGDGEVHADTAATWRRLKRCYPLRGGTVSVRVARIDAAPLARFPLVLEPVGVAPDVAACFLPAADFKNAYDLRGAGQDPATLDALTGGAWSGGREYDVLNLQAGMYGPGGSRIAREQDALGFEVRATYAPGPGGAPATAAAAADAAAVEAAAADAAAAGGPRHGRVLEIGWTDYDGIAGSL